jgi:hypothetical protein
MIENNYVIKMNKKQIVASLNKIANELDNSGLFSESSTVTKVMSRLAFSPDFDPEKYQNSMDNPEESVFDERKEYFGVHNQFTDALDNALKTMEKDPNISSVEIEKAEEIMRRIRGLVNELLMK